MYLKNNTKLKATIPVRVFIDKKYYNEKLEYTHVGKIPEDRREDLSWKGCYYTIKSNEIFYFDRDNDWDRCYFRLANGAEFLIDCRYPTTFTTNHSIIIL